jgi:hypothetical protein
MAINAIASVIYNTVFAGPTGYSVGFFGNVTDGTVYAGFSGTVILPLENNPKKNDLLIREAIAAACFAATTVNVTPPVTGFVIDPNDIYIPLS